MTGPARSVQARFAADPASVPAVRRFVRDALRPERGGSLVDDAELCVSELAGNAALHSGTVFVDVAVHVERAAVLLTVTDEGSVPPEAVVPRLVVHQDDAAVDPDAEATTGRGLGIVDVLAVDWGVTRGADGKTVWVLLAVDAADLVTSEEDATGAASPRATRSGTAPTGTVAAAAGPAVAA